MLANLLILLGIVAIGAGLFLKFRTNTTSTSTPSQTEVGASGPETVTPVDPICA